jgi:hypothetical protein
VTFSFSSTESGSTFQCRIDGPGTTIGSYQSCTSPTTYTSLTDGSYTFLARAIDRAGNVDPTPTTRAFTLTAPTQPDGGPVWAPGAPTITAPGNYSWVRSSTVVVTGTAEAGSTVEVFDDGVTLGTTVTAANGTWSRTLTGIADGSHLFTAKASNLGGTSPSSAMRVVSVDTLAPMIPAITSPAAGSSLPASFTITGTAESGSTVELFEDGSSRGTVAVVGGTWSRAMSSVSKGTRNYTARATDIAGNVSASSAARTVTVTG